jgi:4-hydroxy 2-oxovalerate aldolase
MNKLPKILDCTLRDGGYYTQWDFDRDLVRLYLESMNELPIEYLEVGYRNPEMEGYYGEYYFCPVSTLEWMKSISNKKLAIILNEKDVRKEQVVELLMPVKNQIHLVRMAVDPANFLRALDTAQAVKELGFEVAFNVMYMSKWVEYPEMMDNLSKLDGTVDYFYLVDSYGGVFPDEVKLTLAQVKSKTNALVGFHGHNNLEMALANTLTAAENGIDIIDATITGMGRGAGNLKMELLLTVLNSKYGTEIDFNALSEVTDAFQTLQEQYDWGTSLPYMVSGANSLPQKEVMEWVSKRYYSINSIIRALGNRTKGVKDTESYPAFKAHNTVSEVLIIGGGPSARDHGDAIAQFLKSRPEMPIIHASSKNAMAYREASNPQYFCLVGNEGVRLEKVFQNLKDFTGSCILPPFPREMGTYVPIPLREKTGELEEVTFTDVVSDSHTAIALQTAMLLGAKTAYFVGYDGYQGSTIAQKDQELFTENTKLFEDATRNELKCTSLTPTKYGALNFSNVYQFIS